MEFVRYSGLVAVKSIVDGGAGGDGVTVLVVESGFGRVLAEVGEPERAGQAEVERESCVIEFKLDGLAAVENPVFVGGQFYDKSVGTKCGVGRSVLCADREGDRRDRFLELQFRGDIEITGREVGAASHERVADPAVRMRQIERHRDRIGSRHLVSLEWALSCPECNIGGVFGRNCEIIRNEPGRVAGA